MDKNVTDFNVRLRTIRIRDLVVGIIITAIITGILTVIFPEIFESDELFFIVLFLIGALMFVWALRGTRGLDQNIENIFEENNRKELLYVFAINLLFAFLFTFLISSIDIMTSLNDPTWISTGIDTVDIDSSVDLFVNLDVSVNKRGFFFICKSLHILLYKVDPGIGGLFFIALFILFIKYLLGCKFFFCNCFILISELFIS